MKSKHLKNALLGIVLALVAAYLYFVGFFIFFAGARGLRVIFTFVPFVALFYTSWAVIPLGAALGMLVPQVASGKSRWMAALHGSALGASAGLVTGVCLTSILGFRDGTSFILSTMAAYSALWVGAYAFCRAKGRSLYR